MIRKITELPVFDKARQNPQSKMLPKDAIERFVYLYEPKEGAKAWRDALLDALQSIDPVYDTAVFRRLATQMGWTPPASLSPLEQKAAIDSMRLDMQGGIEG